MPQKPGSANTSKSRDLIAGRYRLLEPLGEGGMGVVFLAEDLRAKSSPAKVALKFLPRAAAAVQSYTERFFREFALLAPLKHPHVIQVFDKGFDADRGQPFFTAEYLDGPDFQEAAAAARTEEVIEWFLQILGAVDYLHRLGVLHKDIKPSNILITAEGAKLLDFGLASAPGGGKSRAGTPGYLAPEIYLDAEHSPASDIFALGMTLYRVIAGSLPFTAQEGALIARQVLESGVPDLSTTSPNAPQEIIAVVRQMTARSAPQRPTNLREIMQTLAIFLRKRGRPEPTILRERATLHAPAFTGHLPLIQKIMSWLEQPRRSTVTRTLPVGEPNAASALPLVLLESQPGGGKSRLLQEVLTRLRFNNLLCGYLAFSDEDLPLPAWTELALQVSAGSGIAIPDALFPERSSAAPGSEGETDQIPHPWSSLYALGQYIAEVGRDRAIVLLIDDLQNAPRDFQEGLRFLSRSVPLYMQVVATMDDAAESLDLRDLLSVLHPNVWEIPPLGEVELKRIACLALGEPQLPSDFPEAIFEKCQGSPGLLLQILQRAIHEKRLTRVSGTWKLKGALPVKPRLADKSGRLRSILQLGRGFEVREAAYLLELPLEETRLRIRELMERGLLEELPQGRFRPTSYAGSEGEEDPQTLKRLALYWSEAWEESQAPIAAERAAQYYGAAAEETESARWALRAGEAWAKRRSWHSAAKALKVALSEQSRLSEQERGYGWRLYAESLALEGRREELRTELETASALSLPATDHAHLLLQQAFLLRESQDIQRSESVSRKALSLLTGTDPDLLRARLLAQIALCIRLQKGPAAGIEPMREAIAALPTDAPADRKAQLLNRLASFRLATEDGLEEAGNLLRQADELFASAQHAAGRAIVLNNQALLAQKQGRFQDLRPTLESALKAARTASDPLRLVIALSNLGFYHAERMEAESALRNLHEALDLCTVLENQTRSWHLMIIISQCELMVGNPLGARQVLSSLALELPQSPQVLHAHLWLTQAAIALDLGDLLSAETFLTRCREYLANSPSPPLQFLLEIEETEKAWLKGTPFTSLQEKFQHLDSSARNSQAAGLSNTAATTRLHMQVKSGVPFTEDDREQLLRLATEFKKQENQVHAWRMQFFLALEACLSMVNNSTSSLSLSAQDFESLRETLPLEATAHPEIMADWEFVQGVYARTQKQASRALRHFYRAKTLPDLAIFGMSPEERSAFLSHPKRRFILDFAIETQPDLLKASHQNMERELNVLRLCNGLDPLLPRSDLLRRVANLFSCDGAAFLALKKGQYRVADRFGELGRIQEDLQKTAPHSGIHRASQNSLVLPLFAQTSDPESKQSETLPLGALWISWKASDALGEEMEFWSGFLERNSFFFGQLFRIEAWHQESKRRLETSSRSLRTMEQTILANVEQERSRLQLGHIIGQRSAAMQTVLSLLERIIPSTLSVLILGESGTGKEMIARTIHVQGPLAAGPFVAVNCGALDPLLAESTLFGHRKGSFTGATEDRIGFLVQADGGTIFLDEIGDLPPEVQTKLLRVLQDGEVRPLGSTESTKSKFRLIAATHRPLEEMIQKETFRADLYYRISGIQIEMPALRSRREDIVDLLEYFLVESARSHETRKKNLSPQARKTLIYYDWPGNIRQMKNVVEMLTLLTARRTIEREDLPPEVLGNQTANALLPLKEAKNDFVRTYLTQLLQVSAGNISETARKAGIRREYLHTLMKELKIRQGS